MRVCFFIAFAALLALPAFGQYRDNSGSCSAEYTWEQCQQSGNDDSNARGPGGGGGCSLPYMCTSSFPEVQQNVIWCKATGTWEDCEIFSCAPATCSPTNCTPRTEVCYDCETYLANNATTDRC